MKLKKTDRGFGLLEHPTYLEPHENVRLVQESSVIGDYADAGEKPGSSYLWVGNDLHLDRGEVAELVEHLERWLMTGTFRKENNEAPLHD